MKLIVRSLVRTVVYMTLILGFLIITHAASLVTGPF